MPRSLRSRSAFLTLCLAAGVAPGTALATPPYIYEGDQTPPAGFEYSSPQPASATASSTCPDWSCGSDRSADNAIDGVQDFGWNSGSPGAGWIDVIFDGGRTASGVHIDGEVQPYPGLSVADAPTVTQIYSLDVVTTDGAHHAFEATWTMLRQDTTPGSLTVNGRDFEFGQSLELASIRITITNVDSFPYDSWLAVDNIELITEIASDDSDGDGVPDEDDLCAGSPNIDTDGDDSCDSSDTCPTDPDDIDGDNDGVCDVVDLCIGQDNVDGDGDQVCDDLDQCEGNDASGDTDEDGSCDADDNCPEDANADQADADGDTIGNACEADSDIDGIIDDEDNCPGLANLDQSDIDSDGVGDLCDSDDDNDGEADSSDNCPFYGNPDQADFDHDGLGNACDGDDDADGVADTSDACPGTPLSAPFDSRGCSGPQRIELVCGEPQDYSFWRRGNYVSCVTREATSAWRMGLITLREKANLIRESVIDVWVSYLCRLRRWL